MYHFFVFEHAIMITSKTDLYSIVLQTNPYKEQLGARRAFLLPRKECLFMGYRKVGYLEQAWYILKYKLDQLFRRR